MDEQDKRSRDLARSARIYAERQALALVACELSEEEFQRHLAELKKLESELESE